KYIGNLFKTANFHTFVNSSKSLFCSYIADCKNIDFWEMWCLFVQTTKRLRNTHSHYCTESLSSPSLCISFSNPQLELIKVLLYVFHYCHCRRFVSYCVFKFKL